MSAPPRLIDSGRSPMVRQLLAAGCTERAPYAVRNQALARAVVVVSSLGATHAAAGTAASSATISAVGVVKAFGAGLLVGAVMLSGAHLTIRGWGDSPTPPVSPSSVGRESATPPPPRSPAAAPLPVPREIVSSLPSGPAATPPVASFRLQRATSAPSGRATEIRSSITPTPGLARTVENQSPVELATPGGHISLAEEMRLIDEARQAIAEGRPTAALAALDRYRGVAPRGRFGPECEALRVEAHALRGEKATARALAEDFLRRHPASPLLERVQAQLGQPPSSNESP